MVKEKRKPNISKRYEEIEFFQGDEGDLEAEDYIEENGLVGACYEWDEYRGGYVVYIEK